MPAEVDRLSAMVVAMRQEARDEQEAQRRAWDATVRDIQTVRVHLISHNYGLADEWLADLLKRLPHDYGAQTFFPLLDEKRAEVEAS